MAITESQKPEQINKRKASQKLQWLDRKGLST